MVKHYTNFNIKKSHRGSIILIGNFDGLHLGHQKLFQLAQLYKKKYNLKIGVVNFNPMPKMFFNKKIKNFRILNSDQKIKLLGSLNVDFIITSHAPTTSTCAISNPYSKQYSFPCCANFESPLDCFPWIYPFLL